MHQGEPSAEIIADPADTRVSPTSDALRLGLLAVGAVRLRYADDPTNYRSAQRIAGDARRRVMKLLDPVLREPEKYMSEIEGTLAAMLSCIVACVSTVCSARHC